jgi:hypothetical protein
MIVRAISILLLVCSTTSFTLAAEQEHLAPPADTQPHPILSQDSSWAGVMLIIVLGMFLAAMVIGPVVRANMPDQPPAPHSDEHQTHGGASHGN